MWAELRINGTAYRVEVDNYEVDRDANVHAFTWTIWEGSSTRTPWDGPSKPDVHEFEIDALRAGVDYLLDGIESMAEDGTRRA